jgi:ubiquinone/menaquinone biosynthesis C-methylase UbiE
MPEKFRVRDSRFIHDEEWRTGWKCDLRALEDVGCFLLVAELISSFSPNTLFDLGCGHGYQAESIKRTIPGVIVNGCDISPSAVNRASKRIDSYYYLDIDTSDLPEKTESYDLVLCIAV